MCLFLGVTYIRWGKKGCPEGVDIVYTGNLTVFLYKRIGIKYVIYKHFSSVYELDYFHIHLKKTSISSAECQIRLYVYTTMIK